MNKKIIFGIVGIVLIAAVAFFVFRGAEEQPQELTPVTVQFRWVHYASFAGMEVADAKGFYEDAGLDVTFKPVDLSQPIPFGADEILGGRADFAEVNSLETLQAFDEGKEIKAVMTTFQISPHAFVSLKESNITSPADFEGKTLGVLRNNPTGNLLYPALLERFDIDPSTANIIPVGFDVVSLLRTGEVDVVDVFRTTQLYQMDKAGLEYNLIYPEIYDLDGYERVIITSQKMIDENPKVVRTFVEATIKGWGYAYDNPEEAIEIVLSYAIGEPWNDQTYEEFVFETQKILIIPTGGQTIGHMDFQKWFNFYLAMDSQGLIENEFEVRDMYTNEFIP